MVKAIERITVEKVGEICKFGWIFGALRIGANEDSGAYLGVSPSYCWRYRASCSGTIPRTGEIGT
jgi:hypothetical protein